VVSTPLPDPALPHRHPDQTHPAVIFPHLDHPSDGVSSVVIKLARSM
jgi:hypothetical protein